MSHQKPLVSICIITYNQFKYLPSFFENLKKQTYPNLEILFDDQNSTDGTADYVAKHHPEIRLIRNENSGYTGGANLGLRETKGDYYMIWTVDVLMEPDYIEIAVEDMERDSKIAAFTGKIYKYDFENSAKTKIIDTVGEVCTYTRRIVDIGQGIEDKGQFAEAREVFGASGQNPIYRRAALEQIKVNGQIYDESLFMYKEDVDIAWRLRLFGYKAWFNPRAIAYHVRGTVVADRTSLTKQILTRTKLSDFQKFYSLSNHTILLIKNELGSTFLLHFPFILVRTLGMHLFTLFTQPKLFFKTAGRIFKLIPGALKSRRAIMRHKKVGFKALWPWVTKRRTDSF